MSTRAARLTLVALLLATAAGKAAPAAPKSMRLYVFDCGTLTPNREGVERYHITMAEAGETRMPVPCFLVAHPKGTLLWDTGVIPDDIVEAQPQGAQGNVNPTVAAFVARTLRGQLAKIGYTPADITYVAVSHAHIDHTANLNEFAGSTWLTRQAERDFMWADNNPRVNPTFYTRLRNSPVKLIETDEFDVFGDGQAIIKAAPGHTPGHQVLILNLAKTGLVMLGGDLYHYPPERTFHRAPPDNEFNVQASADSRVRIEAYLARTKAQLWIQHDYSANAKLRKSPSFYE
jgi:glyoxylase-like metal-dependent hydrolase (beta-lactamase superfamily II)